MNVRDEAKHSSLQADSHINAPSSAAINVSLWRASTTTGHRLRRSLGACNCVSQSSPEKHYSQFHEWLHSGHPLKVGLAVGWSDLVERCQQGAPMRQNGSHPPRWQFTRTWAYMGTISPTLHQYREHNPGSGGGVGGKKEGVNIDSW